MGRDLRHHAIVVLWIAIVTCVPPAGAGGQLLTDDPGRNDVEVRSAPYRIRLGTTLAGAALPGRLDGLGYRRVRSKPEAPGEYFWGNERFWIYRRAHRAGGRRVGSELIGLAVRGKDGEIHQMLDRDGTPRDPDALRDRLEPVLLAESLDPSASSRQLVRFSELPERVWRTVLAAEDSRFFDHAGVDGRALARAALRNAKEGRVVQGGSTITQQLVKIRDLRPRRTLGRKLSEAARALALEADYGKQEILEDYLNRVYFGHVGGTAIYGIGTAARVYFATDATRLDLGQAATLAAMIQGPNRLDPVRHPERVLTRQRWVLRRMVEQGWATEDSLALELARGLPPRDAVAPPRSPARDLRDWLSAISSSRVPRGVTIETTIDPVLQREAERAIEEGLEALRPGSGRLARGGLSAALVALNGRTGEVLAYVGSDPAEPGDRLDRARLARRQPGSAVKPLVLLEPIESCGSRRPLFPARQVQDRPLRVELASGPWEPRNHDRQFRGAISIRDALVDSRNVPMVRVARWCGEQPTAARLQRSGLELPSPVPPSFVLGAIETTPLQLVEAFTLFAGGGRRIEASPVSRLERPGGRRVHTPRRRGRRVVGAPTAYLVRDMMRDAVDRGTARSASIPGQAVWGKTGSTDDAWFVGGAGHIVTVVWVGRDDGRDTDLSGAGAAAPIWRDFMRRAVGSYPPERRSRPVAVVERWFQPASGRLVAGPGRGAVRDLFRRDALPPRRRWYRIDDPIPPIE